MRKLLTILCIGLAGLNIGQTLIGGIVSTGEALKPVKCYLMAGQSNINGSCPLTGATYTADQELPGYIMTAHVGVKNNGQTLQKYKYGRNRQGVDTTNTSTYRSDFIASFIDTLHNFSGDTAHVLKLGFGGTGFCEDVPGQNLG